MHDSTIPPGFDPLPSSIIPLQSSPTNLYFLELTHPQKLEPSAPVLHEPVFDLALDQAQILPPDLLQEEPSRKKRGKPPKYISGPGLDMGQDPIKRKRGWPKGKPRKPISGPGLDMVRVKKPLHEEKGNCSRLMTSVQQCHCKCAQTHGTKRQIGERDGHTICSAHLKHKKEQIPYSEKRPKESPQYHATSIRDHHQQEAADCKAPSLINMVMAFDGVDDGQSRVRDEMVQVGPYKVRANVSHTLQVILQKKGDIAKDFELESGNILSSALENICKVVQELETTKFADVKQKQLNGFYSTVRDAEKLKLNVEWLREGLDNIYETVGSFKRCKEIEGDKKKATIRMKSIKEELESKKAEINEIRCVIQDLESQLESETVKTEKFDGIIDDITSKWKRVRNINLSNGML